MRHMNRHPSFPRPEPETLPRTASAPATSARRGLGKARWRSAGTHAHPTQRPPLTATPTAGDKSAAPSPRCRLLEDMKTVSGETRLWSISIKIKLSY